MKIIGLTPSLDDPGKHLQVHEDYVNAVLRSGAVPLIFPLTGDRAVLDALLGRVDGLVLIGGGDVAPERYGEERLPPCGEANLIRDDMEFYLCEKALDMDLPLLAVCRGEQVLNCVLGGTLYQDIATQYGEALCHPRNDAPREPVHEVQVMENTLLRRLTGRDALQVNSRHHQAVKDVGKGLRVCARSRDGLIEGIEMPGKRFVLGVQWHPEALSDAQPEEQRLFDALAEACS